MSKIILVGGHAARRTRMKSRRLLQSLTAVLIAASVLAVPYMPPAQAIVNGDLAHSIHGQVEVWTNDSFNCSGSLIAANWVITARHCVEPGDTVTVRIGGTRRGTGASSDVLRQVAHPESDVLLLQIREPVQPVNRILQYDDTRRPVNGTVANVNGWGATLDHRPELSDELLNARIQINDNHADPEDPEDSVPGGILRSGEFVGHTGAGDSGAGVIHNGVLLAVHSYDDDEEMYAVALESIRGWIQQITGIPPLHTMLAVDNVRIMSVGDSITHGIGSASGAGYRDELRRRLVADEPKSLDFVGSQQSGQSPDRDHEGYPGAMINDIARRADSAVPLYDPNVVLLHAGTNDMERGNAAAAPAALGSLIDQVVEDAPNAAVLVSKLVPSKNAAINAKIDAFNEKIPDLVAQRARTGKHVGLVDMVDVKTDDLADSLHPNDRGYAKMADAFGDAVHTASVRDWIVDADAPVCSDAPGRWLPRGKIASGTDNSDEEYVQFADINGDKRDDYLLVNDESGAVNAWINAGGDRDGKAGWIERGQIASGVDLGEQEGIDFADINGDGRDDYLVYDTDTGAVKAWINIGGDRDGKPGWIERGQIASGVGPIENGPYFPNVDCDMRDDYVVTVNGGAVRAWLNRGGDQDGKAGWVERGQIASGALPEGHNLAFADIDGDGRDDYLAVNIKDGSVQAWINKGGDPA